jgi:alkylhydroperoxidase family enzyme
VSSRQGVQDEKILALRDYGESPLFSDAEKAALEYADCITYSDRDVSDELFERLTRFFDDDEIVELTAIIAFENSTSKFNRALRVPSQNFWKPAACDNAVTGQWTAPS